MKCMKPLNYTLKKFILLPLLVLLVFAALAVSPYENSVASGNSPLPENATLAMSPNPVQTSCPTSTSRSAVGEFGPVTHLPLVPVHLSVLPDGRVLFWGRDKAIDTNGNVKEVGGRSEAYVWNMAHGSNKTDVAIWRPSEGNWYIINSSTGASRISQWGVNGDVPVPADYDGDGRADLAVFRPSQAAWYIINSSTNSGQSIVWGVSTDVATPGDYDGDGKADLAVFRPSEGNWYIRNSSNGATQIKNVGTNGDIPVAKDYDVDRKTDPAVFRPSDSTWRILKSSTGATRITTWGSNGDVPVPGDYNGDGRADTAVFRPSDNSWRIFNEQNNGQQVLFWGVAGDRATPGDYDGDGKTDVAIFRPSEGNWYILNSSNGLFQIKTWGFGSDIMVPADYDGMLRVANSTTNLFCSGHSFLPDGRLLVSGGHKSPDFDGGGEPHINIFNYNTNLWSRGPDMNQGRWYPYNVALNTGEPLILSGLYWSNFPTTPPAFETNMVPQVYTSTGGLRNLNPQNVTVYPYIHMTPDGKVFQAQSGFISNTVAQDSRLLDPDANQGAGAWSSLNSMSFPHANGSSVLFDNGRKALVVGGFDSLTNPTREAEYIDLKPATGQPTWTPASSMNFPRTYHNTTILPNGKVLVTGGVSCRGRNNIEHLQTGCTNGGVLIPEMWDPTANPSNPSQAPWCQMAPHKEVRAYHSVAALLPDGRVLVGGGGLPGAVGESDANGVKITDVDQAHARLFGHKNVEIYSPPYLFDSNGNSVDNTPGARPAITSAPSSISYGQTFFVGTSSAGSTPKVSLVRLASVTHGFNQDQRHSFLNATLNGSSGLNVTAPADANKMPPGYYMLFVMNSNGVPSVSRIIRVLNTPAYEGWVDGADCNQIWGWAWDRSKPNKPISVDIYAGSTFVATVQANQFRQDLLNADKGNGFHAFVFNVPESLKNGQTQTISVRFGGTGTNLGSSPRSIVCRAVLFPTEVPETTASGAGSTWEQGIEFSSSVSGKITHIRFWKAPGEPSGNHIGRIWTATGVPLASAPFLNETASGWQEAQLQTPLQITAGVRYKVTYNIHSFGAKTFNALSSPITRVPLTGWGSSFSSPAGSFPQSGSTSNLFADIRFNSPQ